MTWRAMTCTMLASALAAIIYVGASGERWPLGFAGAIAAELLHDRGRR